MSNGLSFASVASAIAGALAASRRGPSVIMAARYAQVGRSQTGFFAVGMCLLAAWLIIRLSRPSKLSLRHSPGRPNSLTAPHLLILMALWLSASVGISMVSDLALGKGSVGAVLLTTVVSMALLLAGGLAVAAWTFRGGIQHGLGLNLRHWPWDIARGMLGCIIIIPVCGGLHALTVQLMPEGSVQEHALLKHAAEAPPAWRFTAVFVAVVMAPLAEEIFYRGLMQSMLRRHTSSAWWAIVLAAAIFSAMHFNHPDHLPALFALGIALGYNYERTGRLTSPIVIHALFNALNVLWKLTGPQ